MFKDTDKLTVPHLGLSLQFVTADAMRVDWSELYQDGDEYDVALPCPTYGDVAERAPELMEAWFNDGPGTPGGREPLRDEHAEEFGRTNAFHEWADSYHPAMNYAWPVSLGYGGPSVEEAAALINRHAGNCTLVSFSEGHSPWGDDSDAPDYAIALTGGGMDLSDHLAVAYLCCGCVPPERILSGLSSFTGCNASGRLTANKELLAQAYARAAEYFRNRADRLGREAEALGLSTTVENH
jgi:hypothetical protein